MKLLLIVLVVLVTIFPLRGAMEFKKISQWDHGDKEIYAYVSRGIIDKDGHVVIRTEKQKRSVLITPKDVFFFAYWGEAGDDLYLCSTMCPYGDDIAMVEMMQQRIKIFTKIENKFVWKKTVRLKTGPYTQAIRSIVFLKDKWFAAGPSPLERYHDEDKKPTTISFLTIYDTEGKPIKQLLISKVQNIFKANQMYYYLISDGNRILLMAEDELKVHVVSPTKLEVTKKIALKIPGYYKKMPEDFYIYKKKYFNPRSSIDKDIEYWETSYSRILHMIVEDGYLVIQIQTCDEKLKKFALLFYDLQTFELKQTYFIDDLLLGSRAGKYYFYANGNPDLNENADECIINIYAFEDKK